MTNVDEAAFPIVVDDCSKNQYVRFGLTKRELFAAMAMQGLASTYTIYRSELDDLTAVNAVAYADALIRQLNMPTPAEGARDER